MTTCCKYSDCVISYNDCCYNSNDYCSGISIYPYSCLYNSYASKNYKKCKYADPTYYS